MSGVRTTTQDDGAGERPARGLGDDPAALRALLESIGAGVYLVDGDGVVRWANREAEQLLGRLSADLTGQPAHELLHARRRDGRPYPAAECPLLRVAQDGGRAEEEDDVFVRGDGTLVPVSWVSAAVEGGGRGAVVVFRSTAREHQLRDLREQSLAAERAESERLRAAMERLALLSDASALLAGAVDLRPALARLVRLLVPRLADACALEVLSEHDEGVLQRVAETGTVPPLDALPAAPRTLPSGDGELLLLPLAARGAPVGALALVRASGGFDADERSLAADLGGRTALALLDDRLVREQRAVSKTLQRSLLTMLPHVDSTAVAARYLPAGRHSEVGGDWYDSFLLPSGSTALVIGDIAGHDIDSAARMGQVRNILRGIAVDRDGPPAELLTRLDVAVDRLGAAGLATVVYGRVELLPDGSRQLRWSNAGHPPPLLVHEDGRVTALHTPPDLPLGVLPGEPRGEHVLALPAGGTVLLYTDGLVETRAESVDVGLVRLRRACARHARDPVEAFCDGVLADLEDVHDTPDDIAVLALRVPGAAPDR